MNHSVVTEYIILYSFDLTKRLKKWHDGLLKVYHLNKKVVVFDEAERVICDEFLDTVENLQELTLSNVLVSVEEQKCIYERDVSGLSKGDLVPVKLMSGEMPKDFLNSKGKPVKNLESRSEGLKENVKLKKGVNALTGKVMKPRRVGLSRPKR